MPQLAARVMLAAMLMTTAACNWQNEGSDRAQNAVAPEVVTPRSQVVRVQFKPGQTSTSIKESVLNGTRNTYVLGAKQGQVMSVRISSLENNAVFDVLTPPNSKGQRRTLQQEAFSWAGKLPANGDYQVVVGPTRGNASYRLTLSIQ